MTIIVQILVKPEDYEALYKEVSEPMHNSLAGNVDYIESNIVLNVSPVKTFDHTLPACTFETGPEDCHDKELVREKAKELIDLALNLSEKLK